MKVFPSLDIIRSSVLRLYRRRRTHFRCGLVQDMNSERLLKTMATELPTLIRQLQSSDPSLHSAAVQRLGDFAEMTERWRVRRVAWLQASPTFVAMSVKRDD